MALGDNMVFAHFMDALSQDHPTTNITAGNPATTGDPTLSAGVGTFDETAPGDALLFTQSTGNFLTGGTGDFTVAVRARIDTAKANSNCIIHIGNPNTTFDRSISIRQKSSTAMNLALHSQGANAEESTSNDAFTVGNFFIAVFRRASAVVSLYVDGTDVIQSDGTSWDDFDLDDALDDLTLGGHQSGAQLLDGAIDWAVVWDRALSDTEITTNMNETDLKAALPAGGPTISFPAVGTMGAQLAFTVSEACTRGASYSDAHFSATGSVSGAIAMTYVSGDGTTTFTYSLDKTVQQGETLTFSYAQPGDGLEATTGGADVASFTDVSVTNNSTQTGGGGTVIPVYYRILLAGGR